MTIGQGRLCACSPPLARPLREPWSSSSSGSAGLAGLVSRCARLAGVSGRAIGRPPWLDAAPATTETSLGGTEVVALSTTSATMQVMLSGPPARLARSTSWMTASSGSAMPARARCRVCSVTTSDRPSEHSRYLSPASASRIDRSGSASVRLSSARRISERCGCVAASSALIRPSSRRDWTRV